jgi:hypothetical protein
MELIIESDKKSNLYAKVNSHFRSLEAVLDTKSDDDVRDILQVVIWKNASILQAPPTTIVGTMSVVSKAVTSVFSLPKLTSSFWSELDTADLLAISGKYADVFASEFDSLCRDVHVDLKANLFDIRNRIRGKPLRKVAVELMTPTNQDSSRISLLRESLASLLDMIKHDVDVNNCVSYYRDAVYPKLVVEVDNLSYLYDTKLANCEAVSEVDIVDKDSEAFLNFFNHLILEMNDYLAEKNREIGIQRQNFKDMCMLVKATQAKVFDLLETGGFNRTDLQNFVSRTVETIQNIENCSAPEVTVAVCGETSTGKTTLIGGIVGALCFPTSDAANSACPIRIKIKSGCRFRSLRIPMPLLQALENAFESIRQAISIMRQKKIPTDMPLSVYSEEAREIYLLAERLQEPTLLFEALIGSDALDNDFRIKESITHINGLIRLVYNLKNAERFQTRLSNVHPLSVLLEASDILAVIPEVTASCMSVEGLPFLGSINFIDTPGVSEVGEQGSFMFHTKLIVRRIFERTSRTIILTTPTTLSNAAFKDLRKLVREVVEVGDRMMIAINKFDTIEAGTDLFKVLAGYRMQFAEEGCGAIHVQILQAKVLRDITFGLKDVESIGGLEALKKGNSAPLGIPAQSLLENLYGSRFKKYINKYSDDDLFADCKDLARQSNFENIMRIALQPAFLNAMQSDPVLCLTHESFSLTSLITSLNARLASILKKATAMELLQDSINKIESFMLTVPSISDEIEAKLLQEFKMKAKLGKSKLLKKLDHELHSCEYLTHNIPAMHRDIERRVQYDYQFGDTVVPIVFSTSVFFKSKVDCAIENARVMTRVNTILASSDIESHWEIARKQLLTGANSIVAAHLDKLKKSIAASLSADILNDARLVDVYDSIQQEIVNCNLNQEVSNKSNCVCSIYPLSETATRERDDVLAVFMRFFGVTVEGKEIYLPQYGFYKQIVPLIVANHYSDENCRKWIDDGAFDMIAIMNNILRKLDDLRLRLQGLLNQVKNAVQAEDEVKLRRDIRELNASVHDHSLLRQAITLRSSLNDVVSNAAISTADLEAWKHRMVSEGINSESVANLTPIHNLFGDCENSITFEEAKATLLSGSHEGGPLSPHFAELHEGTEVAQDHALRQFKKGSHPAGMSLDELAALKLYTLPNCFFSLLNKALRDNHREAIIVCRKMIWLILTAMKKLLPSSKSTVFRGIKLNLVNSFSVGQKIVWPAFTSTSTTMKVAGGPEFFGNSTPGAVNFRTFFFITLTSKAAKSLAQVSVLPEEEVLLPPNTTFEVTDISDVYEDGRLDVELREVESVDPLMDIGNSQSEVNSNVYYY